MYLDINSDIKTKEFKRFEEKMIIKGWTIWKSEKNTRISNSNKIKDTNIDIIATKAIKRDVIDIKWQRHNIILSDHVGI